MRHHFHLFRRLFHMGCCLLLLVGVVKACNPPAGVRLAPALCTQLSAVPVMNYRTIYFQAAPTVAYYVPAPMVAQFQAAVPCTPGPVVTQVPQAAAKVFVPPPEPPPLPPMQAASETTTTTTTTTTTQAAQQEAIAAPQAYSAAQTAYVPGYAVSGYPVPGYAVAQGYGVGGIAGQLLGFALPAGHVGWWERRRLGNEAKHQVMAQLR